MNHERTKAVVEDLERVLVDFLHKHQITHEEYRHATDLLIATVKAGEETLLYDVFLEAEATEIGSRTRTGSPQALEGPFYLPGAPRLLHPFAMPRRTDERGDDLLFTGSVSTPSGDPIAGAELDIWQADAEGLYSNIHPGIPDWNLRGRVESGKDGRFEVRSIVPPPYEIPKSGPTGTLLNVLGRHFFRPAHLHVKVRHQDFFELTTQLYFEGGEYLDSDVANGVRDGLVTPLLRRDDGSSAPSFEVHYDFVLATRPLAMADR